MGHDLVGEGSVVEDSVAVFYSISSPHKGLGGVPLGGLLIKQVVATLQQSELNMKYVTLSPVPGFRRWLQARLALQVTDGGGSEGNVSEGEFLFRVEGRALSRFREAARTARMELDAPFESSLPDALPLGAAVRRSLLGSLISGFCSHQRHQGRRDRCQ